MGLYWGYSGIMENEMEIMILYQITGWAFGIFDIFPNGFKKGSYVLILFKGF